MSTTTTEMKAGHNFWREILIGASALCMVVSYVAMPAGTEEIGYMLRVTARIAFVFLLLAYVARPLVVLTGRGRWLVRQRRYIGLAMALAHTVHFAYVFAFLAASDEPLDLVTIVFGGGAFVFMWLMAATSNNVATRRLGKNWKRLHTIGLHYLWIIFMQSFVGRVFVENRDPLYLVLSVAGMAALALRLAAYVSTKRTT